MLKQVSVDLRGEQKKHIHVLYCKVWFAYMYKHMHFYPHRKEIGTYKWCSASKQCQLDGLSIGGHSLYEIEVCLPVGGRRVLRRHNQNVIPDVQYML